MLRSLEPPANSTLYYMCVFAFHDTNTQIDHTKHRKEQREIHTQRELKRQSGKDSVLITYTFIVKIVIHGQHVSVNKFAIIFDVIQFEQCLLTVSISYLSFPTKPVFATKKPHYITFGRFLSLSLYFRIIHFHCLLLWHRRMIHFHHHL